MAAWTEYGVELADGLVAPTTGADAARSIALLLARRRRLAVSRRVMLVSDGRSTGTASVQTGPWQTLGSAR